MDLTSVDLNLLVALDLLLEEGSVRGAAERAHVTPSAMSHTLGRLRDLFDDPLFVRAGRGLVPTTRAEALAEPVRDLLAQARTLLDDPENFEPSSLQRGFSLICTDHVTSVLLPGVDRRLARDAPGVSLFVRPLVPDTMDLLRTGEVDVAIGVFGDAPPEMRTRRLFTDGFVTVTRRDHPAVVGGLDLDTYLDASHLLVAPRGDRTGFIDGLLAHQGHRRHIHRTAPHFLSALWQVTESDLVLTVSRRLVAACVGRFDLAVFPTPFEVPDYTLSLLWHPRLDAAPAERWFRGILVEEAERL